MSKVQDNFNAKEEKKNQVATSHQQDEYDGREKQDVQQNRDASGEQDIQREPDQSEGCELRASSRSEDAFCILMELDVESNSLKMTDRRLLADREVPPLRLTLQDKEQIELSGLLAPVHVPVKWSHGKYEAFPQRAGWIARPRGEWTTLFKNPTSEFKAFMQGWRLIGLVSSLGLLAQQSQVSIPYVLNTTGIFLNTSRLLSQVELYIQQLLVSKRLDKWTEIFQMVHTSFVLQTLLRGNPTICGCLLTQTNHQELMEAIQPAVYADPLDIRSRDIVSMLLDMIMTALLTLSSIPEDNPYPNLLMLNDFSLKQDMKGTCLLGQHNHGGLLSNMRKSGWCPYRLDQLIVSMGALSMLFLSSLEIPVLDDHYQCNQSCCKFLKIDKKKYETRHIKACSGSGQYCPYMTTDGNDMHKMFVANRFPLVELPFAADGHKIRLTPFNANRPYVAISHVWSHGLGNPKANALPMCQLQYLSEVVRGLSGPLALDARDLCFWVDTICCPAGRSDDKVTAIGQMAHIYEKAAAVLVLDLTLTGLNSSSMSRIEIFTRIFSSPWMTRLWTLQEGCLAKKLLFQFADKAFDLDIESSYLSRCRDNGRPIEVTLATGLLDQYRQLRMVYKKQMSAENKLIALLPQLIFRSTSEASDEPICLATLLSLDVHKIVSEPKENRMYLFWSLMYRIPRGLLYCVCKRLTQPGFLWAPRSFIIDKDGQMTLKLGEGSSSQSKESVCYGSNTVTTYSFILALQCGWEVPLASSFFLKTHDGAIFKIFPHLEFAHGTFGKEELECEHKSWSSLEPPGRTTSPTGEGLRLFVMPEHDPLETSTFVVSKSSYRRCAILFGQIIGDKVTATYVCPGLWLELTPELNRDDFKAAGEISLKVGQYCRNTAGSLIVALAAKRRVRVNIL